LPALKISNTYTIITLYCKPLHFILRLLATMYTHFRQFVPLLIFLLFFAHKANAQNAQITITVIDDVGKKLTNATVSLNSKKFKTDTAGVLLTTTTTGKMVLSTTAVNHYPAVQTLLITTDTMLFVVLSQRYSLLNAVVVRSNKNVKINQTSTQIITAEQFKKLPVILGEVDPLKTITLLPGVKGGGDASGGIYVRGGGPDQNLVLLDGVNVYNPNHLLGFFSVFNGDAIKSVEVIKGGFPAEYGGRLSSVININSRDGNKKDMAYTGSVGLISSKFSIEGPIKKDKSSFIISARRTYIDQVARPFARDRIGGNGYFFYDINARGNYQINKNNNLVFTFYTGKDDFSFENQRNSGRVFNTNWGNTIAALSWEQKLTNKLKQKTALIHNQFGLDSKFGFSTLQFLFTSGLKDVQLKTDWNYTALDWLKLKWGINYTWHQFRPGAGGVTAGVASFKTNLQNKYAREAAAYLSTDIDLLPQLNIIAGLRYSYFNQIGPTEITQYDRDGFPTGQNIIYTKGQSIAKYHKPEPRISMRYTLSQQSSLKLSYAQTVQYLHLATTSGATFPSDLWVPSSRRVQPGVANQWAVGYFKNFGNNSFEFSAEAYYKTLSNQIEFKPGATLLLNANLENEMIFGTGKAYGIELFVQKKLGRFTGWLGYTLSRSNRTFDSLNAGQTFAYRYDRTHDLSLVANYKINNKWDFSAVFVYGTGNAITLPVGRYTYNTGYNPTTNQPIFTNIDIYDKVNDYRMPAYHRLDVAFNYTPKPNSTKRYQSTWNFGVYNIYNRANPYFIYLDANETTQTVQGKMVYLFPIIPSATWSFKF
jgi:hypothetical protein